MLHVAVTGRDRPHLTELGTKLRVVVVGYREDRQGAVVDAYVPAGKVAWLRKRGYGVTRLEEVDAPGRSRQAEGRAAVSNRLGRGRYGDVIWGGGYLTADEVETAIQLGARNHAGYFERIALPHRTWEKRRCHAFRIGKGGGRGRPAVCLMGKILAFTIEYGRSRASTPFHPPYPEMRKVMREVAAGLLALCVQAAGEAR